ncbi:MAG TPA: hypothetical protein VKJ01_24440, partial [Candidatus Solibacter sp.]|nr:hypothetical protein [Candidatus Solibacter sp.]
MNSMDTVAGVFQTKEAAQRAAADLNRVGIPPDSVNLLLPGASAKQLHSIPTSDTEQPGVGGAIGGAVGGALGIAGGFELGIAVSTLIPGVGPILAAGIAGAALLGIGGAAGGAAAGSAVDVNTTEGVPADEIFFYEDALRQGHSLVIVLARDEGQAAAARQSLAQSGAESLDVARESWWVGLRDAEAETYSAKGRNFEQDHATYRAGFEAALRPEFRGKSYIQAMDSLGAAYRDLWNTEPFRHGFERGQVYFEGRQTAPRASASGVRS